MGSNSNRTEKFDTKSYLESRAASRDDRQSEKKMDFDAKLRGSIGSKNANEVIAAIDDLKSRGLY